MPERLTSEERDSIIQEVLAKQAELAKTIGVSDTQQIRELVVHL